MPANLYDKVMVPQVGRGERQRDEMLTAEEANELLDYRISTTSEDREVF